MSDRTSTQETKIINAEHIFGYQFNNLLELRKALSGDKLLALLGDSLLRHILIKEGLHRNATRG
jgi:ribonuclease-3